MQQKTSENLRKLRGIFWKNHSFLVMAFLLKAIVVCSFTFTVIPLGQSLTAVVVLWNGKVLHKMGITHVDMDIIEPSPEMAISCMVILPGCWGSAT